jgi:hypothetical protein
MFTYFGNDHPQPDESVQTVQSIVLCRSSELVNTQPHEKSAESHLSSLYARVSAILGPPGTAIYAGWPKKYLGRIGAAP